ncbi:MAG TPA: MerR family transcriptional regulator [Kofleriaceae bacterium]|nr:MerR family transcriptional regulator [Kofleriaceae bacterium]
MALTVGELSRLTGVTVRTLHHYDEIGLVRPSGRTAAGYRLYEDADVLRLQQVLIFRELGMPLAEIATALDHADPAERIELLHRQRDSLLGQRARLDAMLASLDRALAAHERGHVMQPDEIKHLFDGFDPREYDDEARERWGDTSAYQESQRRTQRYPQADWAQLKAEAGEIARDLVALLEQGRPPDDPAVQAVVERHRLHIDRWFYPCSVEHHQALGAMYVADARFQANLDKIRDGYARYLSDAIAASRASHPA